MNILHLNTYDSNGGAAIAARRLHLALCDAGVQSSMAVLSKSDDNTSIHQVGTPLRKFLHPLLSRLENLPFRLYQKRDKSTLFSYPFFSSPSMKLLYDSADIIHLHWIVKAFLSLTDIAAIPKPIVWTLHDTWAFTGGCHYPSHCKQYTEQCQSCPKLGSPAIYNITQREFQHKQSTYQKIKPYIIAPSIDFFNSIQKSSLLAKHFCRVIPNCINTTTFSPIQSNIARDILNLPYDMPIILFGAISATSDIRKGFDLLVDALHFLKKLYPYPARLLVFGASHLHDLESIYPVHCLGHLHDEVSLRLAYSAADVFVCPSREENLPNTIMESLACGTPVAAFAVGGIPDMVEHGINGCLAPPHDAEKLAQEIAYLLKNIARREQMGEAARQVAVERYSAPVIAKQYVELYRQILENKNLQRQ